MVYIPDDIWFHIAQFLPDAVLVDLLAVNSTLLNIALNVRYREVTVTDLVSSSLAKKLLRLNDPYVAQRVGRLSINLVKNREYFLPLKRSRWRLLVLSKTSRKYDPVAKVIQILTDLITRLQNVTSLHICAIDPELTACAGPIFTAAWKTFGLNLHSISLEGELHRIRELPLIPKLTRLRELHLKFTDVYYSNSLHATNAQISHLFGPTLKRLSPTLENLSISFQSGNVGAGYLDLSEFVDQLDPLPQLHRLTVHIPHSKSSDPVHLKRILHNHASTLRHVNLYLDGLSDMLTGVGESRLVALMTELLSDDSLFSNLESFSFSPTTSRAFDVVTQYLARSADTLTSLTLADRYLTDQQVALLASVFIGRGAHFGLQSLTLNIELFHPRLLAVLATAFPGLRQLTLYCLDWSGEDSIVNERNPSWLYKLDPFLHKMITHRHAFAKWGVKDVSIFGLDPLRVHWAGPVFVQIRDDVRVR